VSLYARHHPATFDLTGLSPVQLDAVRVALDMLIKADLSKEKDPYSDEFETARVRHIAAIDVLKATHPAVRAANGENDDDE
jgi:hypothetical protein